MAMDIRAQIRRWRWAVLLAAIPFVATAAVFVNLTVRDSDRVEAARDLVAWAVEGRPLPGYGNGDVHGRNFRKRYLVTCDLIPLEVSLSDDPRVQRVTKEEAKDAFKKHGYGETDYIVIQLTEESGTHFAVYFSNAFGNVGAYSYTFEFRRKLWGLRASGTPGPVS
jgi:hypothetical protein